MESSDGVIFPGKESKQWLNISHRCGCIIIGLLDGLGFGVAMKDAGQLVP